MIAVPSSPPRYAPALIRLLQGVVSYDDGAPWEQVLRYQAEIRAYFGQIGVSLYLSEADGYAFLRQEEVETEMPLPRLVRRMPLNYPTTLLCVLLRERLLQHDAGAIDSPRLVVSREALHEAMLPFFKERTDETKNSARIGSAIKRAVEMGFLVPLKTEEEVYEVRPVLKALLSAEKLAEIRQQVAHHASDDGV